MNTTYSQSRQMYQEDLLRIFPLCAGDSAAVGDDVRERTVIMMETARIGGQLPRAIGVFALQYREVESNALDSCTVEYGGCVDSELAIMRDPSDRQNSDCWEFFAQDAHLGSPLLIEHSRGSFLRPSLRGSRRGVCENSAVSTAWSSRFLLERIECSDTVLSYYSRDEQAGLKLVTQIRALAGGALALRHTVRNTQESLYMLDGLDVRIPLRDDMTELLDFTGRHEHERDPQRHSMRDGMWVRENRSGKPDFQGSFIAVGTAHFGMQTGEVVTLQPMWSGNTVVGYDRSAEEGAGAFAGELLLPGEIVLSKDEEYSTPWIMVAASRYGLDGAMQAVHAWQRSLDSHPDKQLVTLNVWEAVLFRHDEQELIDLAHQAAKIGVERFVLDDGWFHLRRDDHAGLGDWWVDPDVWPHGLGRLAEAVHSEGMEFGLWIEPEMINPNSDTFRNHPDWAMRACEDLPELERHQLVLDLSNPDAYSHVLESISAVIAEYHVDFVKWDHNRRILEGGSPARKCAPSVHGQTRAFYRLHDDLRERFPHLNVESCASGGGRIDQGVVQKVQRFWGSDGTDALSRQYMQYWLLQQAAPEYIGAHISRATSAQTGRTYSVGFRALSALMYGFGIEWDLREADIHELAELEEWIRWYKAKRDMLHSGRCVRIEMPDSAVMVYGVISHQQDSAVIFHVQCEESWSNRGTWTRVQGLHRSKKYRVDIAGDMGPYSELHRSEARARQFAMSGEYLERVGVYVPRCQPQTVRIISIDEVA